MIEFSNHFAACFHFDRQIHPWLTLKLPVPILLKHENISVDTAQSWKAVKKCSSYTKNPKNISVKINERYVKFHNKQAVCGAYSSYN